MIFGWTAPQRILNHLSYCIRKQQQEVREYFSAFLGWLAGSAMEVNFPEVLCPLKGTIKNYLSQRKFIFTRTMDEDDDDDDEER